VPAPAPEPAPAPASMLDKNYTRFIFEVPANTVSKLKSVFSPEKKEETA